MKSVMITLSMLLSLSAFAQTTCGTKGKIEDRIADCGYKQIKDFVLVTKVSARKQVFSVYLDLKTRMLWSDRLYPNNLNYTNAVRACEYDREEMGGLLQSEVTWELPTANHWKQAERDGVRAALPNMKDFYWTATENRDDKIRAYMFNGVSGDFSTYSKDNGLASVRCVAQTY